MLGLEFEIKRKPTGLRHLVLTNSNASMAMWNESNAQLLKSLASWVQEGMTNGKKDLKNNTLPRGICPHSRPNPRRRKGRPNGRDSRVSNICYELFYLLLNAISVLRLSTELKDWNIIDKLSEVRGPVFLINGRFDRKILSMSQSSELSAK